jgi:Protein of unknown function DUF262
MKPYSRSIFDLFDGKRRYEVPLFQRQYVWNLEDHRESLWEDVERKFAHRFSGAPVASPRFVKPRAAVQHVIPGRSLIRHYTDRTRETSTHHTSFANQAYLSAVECRPPFRISPSQGLSTFRPLRYLDFATSELGCATRCNEVPLSAMNLYCCRFQFLNSDKRKS